MSRPMIIKDIRTDKSISEFTFDEEKGEVTFYASVFNNKDSDGDIMAPSAFSRTINNSKRIFWLKNHEQKGGRIGVVSFSIDEKGLLCKGKINMNTRLGREIYENYKFFQENNQPLEHSIGFEIIKRDELNPAVILEVRLWEVSTLDAWAANEKAVTTEVKNDTNVLIDFERITTDITQLKAEIESLKVQLVPPHSTLPEPDQTDDLLKIINEFNTTL